jgi:adenosine/AMP kinase
MTVSVGKAKSILSKSFIENVKDISEDVAAEMVVKAEMKIRELKEEQANDDKLNAAKQIAKDLNAGYSSVIKMEEAKIAYLLEQIRAIQDGSVNPDASV